MTTSHISLKLDKICRGCLAEENILISVFERNTEPTITEMFETCTSLQISEDDGFPSKMCIKCMSRLNELYQFRQMCIQSHFNMINVKVEVIEEYVNKDEDLTDSDDPEKCNSQESNIFNVLVQEEDDQNEYEATLMDNDEIAEEKFDISDSNITNYYECETCLERFETFRDLKQHELDLHMPEQKCTICNKFFNTVEEVMQHSRKHLRKTKTSTKKHQCKDCDKEYTNSTNLKIHMFTHSGIRPFACKECGKTFTKNNALSSHLSLHTGYLSYLCSECGKGFSTATGLKRHKIAHSGERPYKCKVCPRSFTASGDLNVHMRCHTGEKPYLCPTCGKAFSRVSHLNTHTRTHTGEKPYKCKRCDKAFAQSGDLRSHERTHTGERPYECTVCKKTFIQSSGLASHMRTHTGEKSYKCKICNKAFSQGSSLSRHIRCHND